MNELIETPLETLGIEGLKKLMSLNKDSDRDTWHEANLELPETERTFKHSLEAQKLREVLTKKGSVKA